MSRWWGRRAAAWWVRMVVAAGVAACAPAVKDLKSALAEGEEGRVWFTPNGRTDISGDLAFPEGRRPVPAVVLMHGCGGVANTETGWASMGFSHGGGVALRAATEWARDEYGRPGGPRYRAFVSFYPSCRVRSPELVALAGPLRIHVGELDDWTPATPCVRLVRDLKARGQDADIALYPGAHHNFDNPGRPVRRLSGVANFASCPEESVPRITAAVHREAQRCVTRGATVGWNPAATEAVRGRVVEQLGELLR